MKIDSTATFQVGGPRATYVLVICSLLYAVAYADWQVMSVVLQPMKVELGLTDTEVGIINTAYFPGSIAIAAVFMLLVLLAGLDLDNKPLMYFCAAVMPLHSIFGGMALPAVAATTQDVVPARLKGLAWGAAMVALFLLGGAWGPLLVGGVSDAYGGTYQGLALGLATTGLFGFVAAGLWLRTERHVQADIARARTADR